MDEFKIGGKLTLEGNKTYRIIDIIKKDNVEYYFCCTEEKNIKPKLLVRKQENGKTLMGEINNPEILHKIASKMLK